MADPHDDLRDSLARSGAELDLDPIDTDAVLGRAAQRRRRRRSGLAGGALAATVVLGGAVVATRGDDGTIQTTTDTTPPTSTTEVVGGTDGDADESTGDAATLITTPPTLAPLDPAPVVIDASAATLADEAVQSLLPWRDGFLAIGYERFGQPLPELPADIAELFPQEVRDLFADGLPSTIEEASDMLAAAGLLDEVTQVLADHPEAADAIYAQPVDPPRLAASYSADGTEWSPVAISPPSIDLQFAVHDDRLVGWGHDTLTERTGPPAANSTMLVTASTDLVTWETTTIDFGAPIVDTPHLRTEAFFSSLAVVGDQWMGLVQRHEWVDYEALLPDDLLAALNATDGYGISEVPDGITVDYQDADGDEVRRTFTFDELGIARPASRYEEFGTELWTGDFAGFAEQLSLVETEPGTPPYYMVGQTDDRFVLLGQPILTSRDGRSWEPLGGGGELFYVESIVSLADGGSLLTGTGPEGSRAMVLGPDGATTEAELPELPDQYGLWSRNASAAWIVELHDPQPWLPTTVVIEHDGLVLELTSDRVAWSYRLTDATTGQLVAASDGPVTYNLWQYDEEGGVTEIVVTDPTTDAELLRVPQGVHEAAFDAAYAAAEPRDTAASPPDLWLLATTDGVDWLTIDLDDPDSETEFWPHTAAVNGDRVLYRTVDGWALATLG